MKNENVYGRKGITKMKQQKHRVESHNINAAWQYFITWEISKMHLSEEVIEQIERQLCTLCEKEDITVEEVKSDTNEMNIKLIAKQQLNINKWHMAMQKKIVPFLQGASVNHSRIISQSTGAAKNDVRLCKLIDAIREVDYYDLEEGLVDQDVDKLKHYLKEQPLGLIDQDGQIFLIDYKALHQKINLNCFECTKRHQYGCCCGSPCAMSEKNMALLDRHLLKMEESLRALDKRQYDTLVEKGGFVAANGEIKAFDGHCAFLIQHEGVYKCMAHKYALDEAIPIYEICPLSCLMYPLEIMELMIDKRKKAILITAAVEEAFAENLSRWGSYKSLEVELRCIHEQAHDEGFKKEDYQPVYKVNQGLLVHEFGELLFRGIEYLVE